MQLDHLVVTAANLGEGARWLQARLGVAPGPGGRHALMGTHNRLLSLGPDCYLEVIAPDPDAPDPRRPRWFGLDGRREPALTDWVVRADDLDAALAAAPDGAGEATALERGDLRWRMGITADGRTPLGGAHPMILRWDGPGAAERLPAAGCRLVSLTVEAPEAAPLRAALPLEDPRVRIVPGPTLRLSAEIDTPDGRRTL